VPAPAGVEADEAIGWAELLTFEDKTKPGRRRAPWLASTLWFVPGILLVAFNLRPAITSIAPVLTQIGVELHLSGLLLSVLTTAPVICLGLFGPVAPSLSRRFGAEAVVFWSLIGIAAGIALRGLGVVPLFAGTLVVGACMSFLGVLAPALVKRDYRDRVGPMMGFYTMLISAGAAVSTASAVPIGRALGGSWEKALLFWAVPSLIGALIWVPQLLRRHGAAADAGPRIEGLWRNTLAWQVTGFLSLVAALAYAVFSWGPAMLQARGLDAATSGFIVSLSYLAQMPTGLFGPVIAGRVRDQRFLAVAVNCITLLGLAGFIFAPVWSLAGFSILLGLGQGGAFGLALSLIVLRAGNATVAAQLSGMVQSVGYVVGALLGPLAVGLVHDLTGSWVAVMGLYLAVGLGAMGLGFGAGRRLTVDTPRVA
jgi:CP family cyanate transporter-like MFS transporter